MASEGIIMQLLQDEMRKRQQPGKTQQQIQQIMEGIAQGIKMYDAIKELKGKYGHTETVKTSPGSPAIPATPATLPQEQGATVQPAQFAGGNSPLITTSMTPTAVPPTDIETIAQQILKANQTTGSTNINPQSNTMPDLVKKLFGQGAPSTPSVDITQPAPSFPIPSRGVTAPESILPGTPGSPAVPAVPATYAKVKTELGTTDIDALKKAADASPDILRQVAEQMGVPKASELKTEAEMKLEAPTNVPIPDPDRPGEYKIISIPGRVSKALPDLNLEAKKFTLAKQRVEVAKAQLAENIRYHKDFVANIKDQKDADRRKALVQEFADASNNPKYSDDPEMQNFFSDAIQKINETGTIPGFDMKQEEWKINLPFKKEPFIMRNPFSSPVKKVKESETKSPTVATKKVAVRLLQDVNIGGKVISKGTRGNVTDKDLIDHPELYELVLE